MRLLIVSALLRCVRKGSHQGKFQTSQNEPKRCCSDLGRYRDTGTVDDLRRSGRPKATTAVDGRYLRFSARRNLESNATILNNAFRAATERRYSTQTLINRLHDTQLHSCRPWRGPHLTPRHHAAWYRWDQKHAEWTHQNWYQVLFRDECLMCLQLDNRQRRVWRQSGQVERLRHTVQQVQQGGGSLMFWVGIMWSRRTPLHWWSWKALKLLYDTGMISSDLYCNHIDRISRGISVNGRQFSPSSCTSCE